MILLKRRNSHPVTTPVAVRLAGRPLVLFVGILGAGKTTFLRTLLPQLKALGVPARVLINDHHNADVDAATLRHLSDDVTALTGSCVCCDSRDALFDALAEPPAAPGEAVLVETNGTTDALELLDALATDPRTDGFRTLQVSLVDCERWQTGHWLQELEAHQLLTASHVVLTRAGQVGKARRETVTAAVRALNERALPTTPGRLAGQLQRLTAKRRWFISSPARQRGAARTLKLPVEHDGRGHHHHVHDALAPGFTSVELTLPTGLTEPLLRAWLDALPAAVLRVKGVVPLRGETGSFCSFQRVGVFADLARYPAPDQARLAARAILIGPNLDAAKLCRLTEKAFTPVDPLSRVAPAGRSGRRKTTAST